MHKPFKFQPFGSAAMTSVTRADGAEPESLMALVRLFDSVNGFGQFRMFAKVGQGGTLDEVRLSALQAEAAAALLGSPGVDEKLASEMAAIKQEQRTRSVQEEEVQRVHRLGGFEFGKLIETRSGGRLVQRPFQPMCVLSCPKLTLPLSDVVHSHSVTRFS